MLQSIEMNDLSTLLNERILIIDGAMGTMIQQYKLDEAAFRGQQFASHPDKSQLQVIIAL